MSFLSRLKAFFQKKRSAKGINASEALLREDVEAASLQVISASRELLLALGEHSYTLQEVRLKRALDRYDEMVGGRCRVQRVKGLEYIGIACPSCGAGVGKPCIDTIPYWDGYAYHNSEGAHEPRKVAAISARRLRIERQSQTVRIRKDK